MGIEPNLNRPEGRSMKGILKLIAPLLLTVAACAALAQTKISVADLQRMERPEWARSLPHFFDFEFLKVPGWQWLGLALMIVGMRLVYEVLKELTRRFLNHRDKLAGSPITEFTNKALRRSIGVVSSAAFGGLIYPFLEMPARAEQLAGGILKSLALGGGIFLVVALWDAVCDTIQSRTAGLNDRAERLLVPVTRRMVRIGIFCGGALAVLGVFGVNVAALIAGLGIGGLVVALAAKDSVENLFGSLTILFDMPFALGDWVKIDKIEGVVEEINMRSTKIRTFDDSLITLPNSNLIKASVENYGARRMRRQRFFVKFVHAMPVDSIESFCTELKSYIETIDGVDLSRITVEANEYEELNICVLVQCYVEAPSAAEEFKKRNGLMLEVQSLRQKYNLITAPAVVANPPTQA